MSGIFLPGKGGRSLRMGRDGRGRQAGVVLIVALIALVAMTLAAIALVRSIDTGLVIAGNIAFKQSTTSASDVSVDAAVSWLENNPTLLNDTYVSNGYYANWMEGCDMTGNKTPTDVLDDVDWDGSKSGNTNCNMKAVVVSDMPTGYSAHYVVNRMCYCDGPASGTCGDGSANYCAGLGGSTTDKASHGVGDYINRPLDMSGLGVGVGGSGSAYYRITTRVVGPRNTTSFVETIVVQ